MKPSLPVFQVIESENKEHGRSYSYLTTMKQHWIVFLDEITFPESIRLKVIGWDYGTYNLVYFKKRGKLLHDSQYTALRRRIGTRTLEQLEEICSYQSRRKE